MVVVAVAGIVAVNVEVVALFWVEIVVALFFVVFWAAQTLEPMGRPRAER